MNVTLIVVDDEGVERPGWALRAGDVIRQTDYDHEQRLMTARVGESVSLRLLLRRWWDGFRKKYTNRLKAAQS